MHTLMGRGSRKDKQMTPNQKLVWAAVFDAEFTRQIRNSKIGRKEAVIRSTDYANSAVSELRGLMTSGEFVDNWSYEMGSGTDTSVKQQRDSKRCPECDSKEVTENTKGTHAVCLFCGQKGEIQLFKGKSDSRNKKDKIKNVKSEKINNKTAEKV